MTKDEYLKAKAKIVQDFGTPEYDLKDPINESAKRINTLLSDYRNSCRQDRIQLLKADKEALDAVKSLKQAYEAKDLPAFGGSVEVNENDLLPFNENEKEAIRIHFENFNLKHKQIALKLNGRMTRQGITALLDSPAYKILESKVFDRLLPSEVKLGLLAAVRSGDSKIIQRLAEHFKVINPEKIEFDINKPLEDPVAIAMLKKLGDDLIDGKKQ